MLATNNLRKNHLYRLINDGYEVVFEVIEVISDDNYLIKETTTLEKMEFQELIRFGIASDYLLESLDS